MRMRRWSDDDHYWGPFTYAYSTSYRPLAVVLASGDDDESPGCSLRLSGWGHTFIADLPPIIRPWREKVMAPTWDAATVERMGRNWYWNTHNRQYGFSLSDGFLQVFHGRQTHDSRSNQTWCKHLPWTQWEFRGHRLYGVDGALWVMLPTGKRYGSDGWNAFWALNEACPSVTFAFTDYDGEHLTAATKIEEREWSFGTGWFKWLALFRPRKIRRSLDIKFSGETGKRKGSWKGGTVGHSIDMLPGELHEAAFRRYCAAHDMAFGAPTFEAA